MYGNGNASTRKRERKLSIIFRHTDAAQHCAGVEAVAVASTSECLYTGSRDSTIRRWDVSVARPLCEAALEGHTDWVNDLLLVGSDLLASCSSDTTVKLWHARSGACVHTFSRHSDYALRLAAAKAAPTRLLSAGLRGEVFVYDLERGHAAPLLRPPDPGNGGGGASNGGGGGGAAAAAAAHKASVYALALGGAGNVAAAGGTDGVVRLTDVRTGAKVAKLKGHTDVVRAVLLSPDGTQLISGSSDRTIRLWDAGSGRCIQTFAVHDDSVWALAVSEDWGVLLSGGRDKAVWRTSLAQRRPELLLREDHPVRALALHPGGHSLWVSTTASSIRRWAVPDAWRAPPARGALDHHHRPSSFGRTFVAGSPAARLRQSLEAVALVEPATTVPEQAVPGTPGIVRHKALNDRRRFLVQDAEGAVALVDVLTGERVASYGRVDFAAKERELFSPVSVPVWCASDTRLGCLALHLEPPGCFSAEVYAVDLDMPGVQDDVKLNIGATLLRNAMRTWGERFAALYMSGAPLPAADGLGDAGPRFSRDLPPAVMFATASGASVRCLATAFTGKEREGEEVPQWVADCCLRGLMPYVKDLKAAFVLLPEEGSGLPSLLQSRLNAPRILEVKKVANYCSSKLMELNLPVMVHQVGWTPSSQVPPDPTKQWLELTCNGMAVPYDMSIASVKKFVWKRSEDVVFAYRIMDPTRPAPLPQFTPPS